MLLDSIDYTVRVSQRAKHVNLRLTRLGELEVVIPPGFDRAEIPSIILKHERWYHQATARLAKRQPKEAHLATEGLPQRIELRAIGQPWLVEYTPAAVQRIQMRELDDPENPILILWGNTGNESLSQTALTRWLSCKADEHFAPWIRRLSEDTNLPFNQVSFRGQKTRWGSCSSDKNISLNYKLLFLPAPLVNYVFIHELAHTVHMNHSAKFWALVEQHEADYRQLDRDLNDASQYIPRWLERWLAKT